MKHIKKILLIAAIFISTIAAQAQIASISIEITNINSNNGQIWVRLFNSEKNFLHKSMKTEKLKAKVGNLIVTFKDIPNGTYTVSVVHDENSNGKLDTNFMRIPSEPYGISMKGKSMFGPPSYNKAKFDVNTRNLRMTIKL